MMHSCRAASPVFYGHREFQKPAQLVVEPWFEAWWVQLQLLCTGWCGLPQATAAMWTLDRPRPSGTSRWGGHSLPAFGVGILSRLPLWFPVPRSSVLGGVLRGGSSLAQLPALFPGTVVASLLQTVKALLYGDWYARDWSPPRRGRGCGSPGSPCAAHHPGKALGQQCRDGSRGFPHSCIPRAVASESDDSMLESSPGSRETGSSPRDI